MEVRSWGPRLPLILAHAICIVNTLYGQRARYVTVSEEQCGLRRPSRPGVCGVAAGCAALEHEAVYLDQQQQVGKAKRISGHRV